MDYLLALLIALPMALGLLAYRWEGGRGPLALGGVGVTALVALLLLLQYPTASLSLPLFGGIGLEMTPFGGVYVLLTCILWLVALVLMGDTVGEDGHLARLYAALLVTLGATLGVFLAQDLFTLFVFFEIMSFTSCLWVFHSQNRQSVVAGGTYLAFTAVGGIVMLFGILLLAQLGGDLTIAQLETTFAGGGQPLLVACFLLFVGFGTKAGAFFLHCWLPAAYGAAPAPATALLSGVLSKAGIYGTLLIVVKILPHSHTFSLFLLVVALLNMLVGGLCALLSSNLKVTLAYSSISQVGFILWGIALVGLLGEEGTIALYGTLFHMVNHSLTKVLLFLLAGIVLRCGGSLELSDLRGIGRGKPWLHGLFLVGGLSLAGVPLLAGYGSKTLLHEALVEYIYLEGAGALFQGLEYLFLRAGGMTLCYMGKLYLCLFWQGEGRDSAAYASRPALVALTALALALVALGLCPSILFGALGDYCLVPYGAEAGWTMAYFTLENFQGAAISLSIGTVLLVLGQRLAWGAGRYPRLAGEESGLEKFAYRPLVSALSLVGALGARLVDISADLLFFILSKTAFTTLEIPDSFYHGEDNAPRHRRSEIHITYSLAYSLLMFGLGFLLTVVYLLAMGGRG